MKKLVNKYYDYKRSKWLSSLKKKLNNNNFTIISNNCTAGFIYHDLGLQFTTPTINLFIRTEQYITFVSNLKYYLSCPLIEDDKNERSYPVGILKSKNKKYENIYVYFNHYNTFEEAKEKWNSRKKRINFENIFFILDFYDSAYDIKSIDTFNDTIKCNDKIVLTHNPNIKKDNCFCFKYKEDEVPNGKLYHINNKTGKRNLDEWNYISFINSIHKKKHL